jgi:putative ABC transport system permease protein
VTVTVWVGGLLRRRPGQLLGAAAGIAVAVALLASLGAFLAHSQATMTDRAVRGVGIDWQVQVQAGADAAAIDHTLRATVGVVRDAAVGFGTSAGLSATTGGSTQTTGPAVVLGLPADYRELFPAEVRTLAGADSGVLLAQQTAANLHAAPGDEVTIALQGLPPATVTVAGVVELPLADSLFQRVGAPTGTGPSAPPDNVLLLPANLWHPIFDPLATDRPDLVGQQIHVLLDHHLPAAPADAFVAVSAAARHFEAAAVGGALVGDNLGAALDAARSDAAFALVLFLFLGLPGAVLAALLTVTVAAAGGARRRGERALLRARGASASQLNRLAGAEAAVSGVIGAVMGLAGAALVGWIAFGTASFGVTTAAAVIWAAAAAGIGLAIAVIAILLPARRELRRETVTSGRAPIAPVRSPAWARYGLDLVLLIIAGLIFAATSGNGYQLVLAPEGVPTIAVSYWALAGPALLWIGAGLLIWRVADLLIGHGRPLLRRALRPLTGSLAGPVSAGLARQRRPLVRAIVLLAMAISFAVSTAVFNATYAQQAEADALLTNGADVTVVQPPGTAGPPGRAAAIATVPGVIGVEPMLHRFAYLGSDLQDLYGVRPDTIASATALQDSYFSGGTTAGLMRTLAREPDSILVSAETVLDYQLVVGDTVNLRLSDRRSDHVITVPFRYVGVVSEFPTAPRDSFFVANAAYVAERTGDDAVGVFLVDTAGTDPAEVVHRLGAMFGTTASVTGIDGTRQTVGSSLTAVDLAGLTRVELTFALIIAVAAAGVVFGLGLAERRRTFAIVTALGATGRQLRGMISSEALVLAVIGLVAGVACGAVLSVMLVKVLTDVFDPPPATLAVPWRYLGTVTAATTLALTAVTAGAVRAVRRPAIGELREL